jgi:phosphate:Na+ symporter
MTTVAALELFGGLGLFLLGIYHLTEGLKSLAGDSLRRALQTVVSGRFSAVASGALFTAAIQSSSATIFTVIGFVSAGLITFPQALGINIGATLGTTSTPWLMAIFGFRIRIALVALPILGIGALLWIVGRGRWKSLGAILAGFGLIFTGIDFLQTGMKGISWNLESFAGTGAAARWVLAAVGLVMTIVMQSSTAAAATTLVALDAGSLTFEQGCAMVVGQSIGTAAKAALAALGGGIAVRRTAFGQIIFSVTVGILGLVFLGPLVAAADWVGARLHNPDGVLALAAFSTIFKLAAIAVFYPWLDQFADFIVRISGTGVDTAVSRLDPIVAETGGPVALETAWRATLEVARVAVDTLRGRLAGESVKYAPQAEAIQQIDHFLESVALDTIDPTEMELRLVRLCHALDHLSSLERDLGRIPPAIDGWQPPASFEVGAHKLAVWLDASLDPNAPVDPVISLNIHEASKRLSEDNRVGRERLLDDIALKRTSVMTARGALDALAWADGALYDAWRLTESLQTTAAYDRSHVVGWPPPDLDVRDAQRPDRPGPATQAA